MTSPRIVLALFCSLNLLIYLDRGAISSNGVNSDGIQQEFEPSLFQDGLLPAAFMVGLLLSSPVFATLSMRRHPMRLIGYGLSVWAVSVFLCGCSIGFWNLVACRMAVGIGEASFVALASPFIDDYAPKEHKALWLGMFYACIPVGYALGFLYGGTVGVLVGWRVAFILESLLMVPFILCCFRMDGGQRDTELRTGEDEYLVKTIVTTALSGMGLFWRYPIFLLTSLGMTCYTAVIGSYAYYGPDAAKNVFDVSSKTADLSFSVMTVVTGILGTFCGGYILDMIGSSIRNGMMLCSTAMIVAACAIAVSFLTASQFLGFCIVFSIGEFLLFATQAPGNALILWSVPHEHRSLAVSMSVVCMHILGDVPGPPVMGLIEGAIGNWRYTMALATIEIALGGLVYALGIRVARKATDFRLVTSSLPPPRDGLPPDDDQEAQGNEEERLLH